MTAAVELATAYITVAASGSDLAPSFGRSFKAVEKVAGDSGKRMGRALTGQVAKATEDDVKKAKDAYEQASKKVASTVETQAVKVEAARRKEEIAQAKVTEAMARYDAESSQVLSAQDRLAMASQKVEAAQRAQESATEKANRELNETERQLKDTERAAESAATPFERLGDRVKSALRGDFKGAFKPVEREGENAAEEIERDFKRSGDDSAKGFGSSFKAGFAGALGGLGAYVGLNEVFDWGKYAVSGAADLEQSIGGVETVFKDSAGQMLAWSDAADQTLGLTANEYNEFSAKLGASLKNAGTPMDELGGKTNDLITMGADLASLYGGTTAEAVDALGSALRGEMDPIERYGISLNAAALDAEGLALGMDKTGASWSTQEKQLISMSLLQKQSADATGNFAREQNTASNVAQRLTAKLKDTAAELGSRLTPYLADLGGWILDKGIPALEDFGKGIDGIWSIIASGDFKGAENTFGLSEDSGVVDFLFNLRDAALSFGDVLTGTVIPGIQGVVQWLKENQAWLVPVAAGILAIVGAWKIYQTWLLIVAGVTKAYAAVQAAFNAVMAMNPIGLVVLAIIGLAAAFVVAYKRSETFRNIVNAVWDSIKAAAGAVADWFMNYVWPAMKAAWDGIAAGALWLYQNAILPAWNGIKAAVAATVDWIVNTAWPAIQTAWTAISAGALWLYQNAILPAWAGIKTAIAVVADWITGTLWPALQTAWSAIGTAAMWLYTSVIQPVWDGIRLAIAVAVTAVLVYIDLMKWYFTNVIAPAAMWLWRNVISPVWAGIQAAIGAVVAWVQNTAWPMLKMAWDAIAAAAQWLYSSVILPVWNAIRSAISTVVSWMVNVGWPALKLTINWIANAMKWLYNNVILPVWNAIRTAISAVVSWLQNVAWPLINTIIGWLKTSFNGWKLLAQAVWSAIQTAINAVVAWFRDTAWPLISSVLGSIKTGFTNMKDRLKSIWDTVKNTIIKPVVDWITGTVKTKFDTFTDNVKSAFTTLKDGVLAAWDAIKDGMKSPINGVIGIYNKHIAGNFNDVIETIFGKDGGEKYKLSEMKPFATGGILPGQSSWRDGDDQIISARRGEGVLVSEGLRDRESQSMFLQANEAARTRGVSFANFVSGAFAGGGIVKLRNPFSGSYPRGDGFGARNGRHEGIDWPMPDGATLKAVGAGTVSHTFNPLAGRKLNLSLGNGLVAGYHHLSSYIAGRGDKVGAGADIARVGSSGKSTGPHLHFSLKRDGKYVDPAPYLAGGGEAGSGGGGSWWNPFDGLWGSIKDKVSSAVGEGTIGGVLSGVVENTVGGIAGWVADKLNVFDWGSDSGGSGGAGGAERWRDIASQALQMKSMLSPVVLDSLMRRMNQESGGNPRAINNWDSNAAAGMPSKGLMQVIPPTFSAYAESGYSSDIYDPLSNILASINYTKSRYGSLTKGWNRSGGYAEGGLVDGGIFDTGGVLDSGNFALNLSGRPEVVLNPAESRAYMAGQASTGRATSQPLYQFGDVHGHSVPEIVDEVEKRQRRRESLRVPVRG